MLVSNLPCRLGKTLLVCTGRRADVENQLVSFGCRLTKVRGGDEALRTIRHERFDTTILLSTGGQMDLVETILNLRDIRPSMPVIVLIDPASVEPNDAAQAIIAHAIPEVTFLSLSEFHKHPDSTGGKKGGAK